VRRKRREIEEKGLFAVLLIDQLDRVVTDEIRVLGRVYNQNGIMRMLTAYIIAAKQVSVFS
jgi:hypothetical protein